MHAHDGDLRKWYFPSGCISRKQTFITIDDIMWNVEMLLGVTLSRCCRVVADVSVPPIPCRIGIVGMADLGSYSLCRLCYVYLQELVPL